jgi:hypothetical protein
VGDEVKAMEFSFEMLWIVGIVILGVVVFFFATRQRRLTPHERARTDKVAHENWGKEEIR